MNFTAQNSVQSCLLIMFTRFILQFNVLVAVGMTYLEKQNVCIF
jgi:hypothetical protein